MKYHKYDELIEFIKPYISMATLLSLVSFIIYMSRWVEHIEGEVAQNQHSIERHIINKDEHMPLKEKYQMFVPRIEIDQRLQSLDNKATKIDNKLDKILEQSAAYYSQRLKNKN